MNTQRTSFLNKNGIQTQRQVEQEKFITWMRDKVHSRFYADNEQMAAALERITA